MNLSTLKRIAPSIKFHRSEDGYITCNPLYHKMLVQLYIIHEWENLIKFKSPSQLFLYLQRVPLDGPLLFNKDGSLVHEIEELREIKTDSLVTTSTLLSLTLLTIGILTLIRIRTGMEKLIHSLWKV